MAWERLRERLFYIAAIGFAILAAVAAALGCPVFRNPGTYATAGGAVAGLRGFLEAHRKR